MAQKARRKGVNLRPHVKTHKIPQAAKLQIQNHFGGITVSTIAEAVAFADAGFCDITYAVPLSPNKVARVLPLAKRIQLQVLVDNQQTVDALLALGAKNQHVFQVLIKVDCGYHRAGLLPTDPLLISLAQQLHHSQWINFCGVLSHGGHSYNCIDRHGIAKIAEQEREQTLIAANSIRASSVPVRTVSIGSTPTCAVGENLTGITEIRPGNYIFFDRFQAAIGSCTLQDVALSVLTEVIGYYPGRNCILIDAGALALSKDQGATHTDTTGYGSICSEHGTPIGELELYSLSQEHGKIRATTDFDFSSLQIGSKLRIIPNHSCLVTALHEQIHVVQDNQILQSWTPIRGW